MSQMQLLWWFLRKARRISLRVSYGKFLSWLPLPVHLSWGGWWLASDDVASRHVRLRKGIEGGEQNFLLRFLQPGMTVLDLGAHHGLYTLLFSRRVGVKGRVIAFEPSPRERRRLQWHIRLNRCANVQVELLALGSSEGVAELFVCLGRETGCNSLRPPAVSEPTKSIEVSVTTLDNYLQNSRIDLVDFIKLDVEGAELEVPQGGSRLISNSKPLILCELADVRTEPWGHRSVKIYQFLVARGYRWFSVMPEGKLRPCSRKEQFHENLFAVPKEKLRLIAAFVEESGR